MLRRRERNPEWKKSAPDLLLWVILRRMGVRPTESGERMKPYADVIRQTRCMSGYASVLPIPGAATVAEESRPGKTRVDYRKSEEADLVRRVQARDELAFREIVDRYQSKIFNIIYGILRNRNDAEDIAQQVFAKIYFSINSFDFRSSLLTWIYKITVNECYDYLRKKKVRNSFTRAISATKRARTWSGRSRIPPDRGYSTGQSRPGGEAAVEDLRRRPEPHAVERG